VLLETFLILSDVTNKQRRCIARQIRRRCRAQ